MFKIPIIILQILRVYKNQNSALKANTVLSFEAIEL